jgi:hypothetical protein
MGWMSWCWAKCCESCNITICVAGCGANIAGDTVEIKSGATLIASGVTGSGGCVTLSIPASGSYTVVVIDPSFGTITGTHTLTCGGTITISLGSSPADGYCCGTCTIPNTLFVTDSEGTWTATGGFGNWGVCYMLSVTGVTMSGTDGAGCTCSAPGTISIPIQYIISCVSGQLNVQRWYPGVCCGTLLNNICIGGSVYYVELTGGCSSGFPTIIPTPCYIQSNPANPFKNESVLQSAWSSCYPFAWSGNLVTSGFIADPVGAAVSISS